MQFDKGFKYLVMPNDGPVSVQVPIGSAGTILTEVECLDTSATAYKLRYKVERSFIEVWIDATKMTQPFHIVECISKIDRSSQSLSQACGWTEAFKQNIPKSPDISDKDLCALVINLLKEEVEELEKAYADNDLVEVSDAMGDIQFVLDWGACRTGFYNIKETISTRVFESNMSKLGEDGKPILREDGKILKGPNFKKPEFADLFTSIADAPKQ